MEETTKPLHILAPEVHTRKARGKRSQRRDDAPIVTGESLMPIDEYMDVVCSVHLSSYVDDPTNAMGGLMIVGPPSALKSTIVAVIDEMDKGHVCGNINMTTFRTLLDRISTRNIRTLAFEEFANIYAGDPRTASRVESTIQSLVEQGNRTVGLQDETEQRFIQKCVIIGAMTTNFKTKHFSRWNEMGFSRRFLWSLVALENSDMLLESVIKWKRIQMSKGSFPNVPLNLSISNMLTSAERTKLLQWMGKGQPGEDKTAQLRMLCKITCALKWHYQRTNQRRRAMETMKRFCASLQLHGVKLVLPAWNGK